MIKISKNSFYSGDSSPLFNRQNSRPIQRFHQRIGGYSATPLVTLNKLAKLLGIKAVLVKDESQRFGLNAFKVLGGSYALGQLLAEKLDIDINEINFKTVASLLPQPMTFATATAGNHGTGVAWAAREMSQQAVVYMPKGASQASVDRIRNLGAKCIVTDVNYDDTVRLANQTAQQNNWQLVQDTAWPGYEKIPTWISQGYMTMAAEAHQQLDALHITPSHIFLQAGVGAMAGGVLGYFASAYGADNFTCVITEPDQADCIYRSGTSADGKMQVVSGELNSIMAGLACGEPNPVTWPILRDCSHFFASVSDDIAATGMRVLANPIGSDKTIISGESGAISLGLLFALSQCDNGTELAKDIGLNSESVVLVFSSEGDTNQQRYQDIVVNGRYPLEK